MGQNNLHILRFQSSFFFLSKRNIQFPRQIIRHSLSPAQALKYSIAKLLVKCDAIPLFESFRHFAITDNPTSVHNTYTVIDRLPATDAFYRRVKKFTHAQKFPFHIYNDGQFPCLICLCGKKFKAQYFLIRPRVFLTFLPSVPHTAYCTIATAP